MPSLSQQQGTDELVNAQLLQASIQQKIDALERDFGLAVLRTPGTLDQSSALHQTIFTIRWRPADLLQLGPHKLVEMESIITAMQVHVLWTENFWRMRNEMLGRAVAAAMIELRGSVSADTVKAKEIQLLKGNPELRQLHNAWTEAHALDHMLRGMGAAFVQLEDGLKRTIDLARLDYMHARKQGQYQT